MDACTEGEKLMTSNEFLDFRRKTKVQDYFKAKFFQTLIFEGFLSNSVTD
jgi:hypothetical protein